jgi:hypothetical protein
MLAPAVNDHATSPLGKHSGQLTETGHLLIRGKVVDHMQRSQAVKSRTLKREMRDIPDDVQPPRADTLTSVTQRDRRYVETHPIAEPDSVLEILGILNRAGARVQEHSSSGQEVSLDAKMASVSVLACDGAQVLIAGVLVQPLGDLLPADGVVEITNLLLDPYLSVQCLPGS